MSVRDSLGYGNWCGAGSLLGRCGLWKWRGASSSIPPLEPQLWTLSSSFLLLLPWVTSHNALHFSLVNQSKFPPLCFYQGITATEKELGWLHYGSKAPLPNDITLRNRRGQDFTIIFGGFKFCFTVLWIKALLQSHIPDFGRHIEPLNRCCPKFSQFPTTNKTT